MGSRIDERALRGATLRLRRQTPIERGTGHGLTGHRAAGKRAVADVGPPPCDILSQMQSRAWVIAAAAVALACQPAAANPDERSNGARLAHAAPVILGGGLYLVLELPLKTRVSPVRCRWCEPNGFDDAVRSALRWDNVRAANTLSNLTGYFGNPLYASGLLLIGTDDAISARRYVDNTTPVLQSAVAVGLLNQALKIVFARKRPFLHYGAQHVRPANDVYTSFFSGHTALAFSLAVSSGIVANLREYPSAPAIWIGGLTLATATGYLRIAGDAHYATDVLTGAIVGSAIGVAIPLLLHRDVLTDEDVPMMRTAPEARPVMVTLGGAF